MICSRCGANKNMWIEMDWIRIKGTPPNNPRNKLVCKNSCVERKG